MSNDFDSVTISAMKLCAARHNAAISDDTFIALAGDFARALYEAAKEPAIYPQRGEVLVDGTLRELAPAPQERTETPPPDPPKPPWKGNGAKRSHKLSYDDKVRIKSRYEHELEERKAAGLSKVRSGFIAGLAAEFGVTDSTIYNVVANKDS